MERYDIAQNLSGGMTTNPKFSKNQGDKHTLEYYNFKTNNVTKIRAMFQLCSELEYLDLSNFDIPNVLDMEYLFAGCHKLKKIQGIEKFIGGNMTTKFSGCDNLNIPNIKKSESSNSIAGCFTTLDQNIKYPMPCSKCDVFSKLEQKTLNILN